MWASPGSGDVDLLGIGQVSLDRVVRVPRLPASGEKLDLASPPEDQPGGQIATAVLAATRLGLRGAFIGAVGDDPAAGAALAPLRDAGVDLTEVRRVAGARSRAALVLVDAAAGERVVLAWRDPSLALAPEQLSRSAIGRARVLLVDAEDPDASRFAAQVARDAGTPVVLDADRATPGALALARNVDFPIVSKGFAEQFSETGSPVEALRALTGPGVCMPIVTLGERGSLAAWRGDVIERPAVRVPVRDTTGAGDAFRGGFVWGLLQGGSARDVLAAATAVAALACRAVGAQGSLPTGPELREALREPA